jgi:AraC-like DNA-binding protein
LTPIVFSTEAVEARHQRDYWVGRYDSFNRLDLPEATRAGFTASNEIWNLGDFALLRNSGPAVAFERTSRRIRRDSLDHLVIRLIRFGEARHRAGDTCVAASPLVPLVFSLGEPYAGDRSGEADWISLYITRDRFPDLSAGLSRLGCSTVDTAGGRLLADYMLSLHRRLPQMDTSQIPMLVQATRSMISACLLTGIDAAARASAASSPVQFEIVRRIVRQNIGSPTLGPEKIGRLAGISRSQLYRLFEPHGGVARYVQRVRLQMVHALLTDAATTQLPIAATAERAGFFDASAFSRAFRREFGYTPRAARAMASDGSPIRTGGGRPQAVNPGANFGTLLRQLGAFGGDRA